MTERAASIVVFVDNKGPPLPPKSPWASLVILDMTELAFALSSRSPQKIEVFL